MGKMAKFRCKDIGMKCGFEIKDENQDELMKMIALHAETTHNMKDASPEMQDKIKKAIRK
jgi:predicted small metal-binding protein